MKKNPHKTSKTKICIRIVFIFFISTSVTVATSKPEQKLVSTLNIKENIFERFYYDYHIKHFDLNFVLRSLAKNEHIDYFVHI